MSTSAIVDEIFFPTYWIHSQVRGSSRSDEKESRWVRERVEVGVRSGERKFSIRGKAFSGYQVKQI